MSVVLEVKGGLGNQLFQYSAAYAIAQAKGCKLYLDTSFYDQNKGRDYRLDAFHLDALVCDGVPAKRPFPSILFGAKPFKYKEKHFHYDVDFLNLESRSEIILDGYFQSECYFSFLREKLLSALMLKKLSSRTLVLSEKIRAIKMPISLHLRRGDYLKGKNKEIYHQLTPAYYEQSLALLREMYGTGLGVVFFSDDINYLKEHFTVSDTDLVIDPNASEPEQDLHLMSLCHHHIIANSSFSWWGAWLSQSQNKTTIAPKQWFSKAYSRMNNTCDLIPEDWIKI